MLGLFVYDVQRARYGPELTADVTDCIFGYSEHGCVSCQATMRASLWDQAHYLVSVGGQLELRVVTQFGRIVWAGRLEQPTARSDGQMTLTAWGYWRALTDVPYLALHSDVGYARWFPLTAADLSSVQSQAWEQDKYNRLYTAPRKNETHSTTTGAGWKYLIPNGASTQLVALEFNYDFLKTLNWQFRVARRDSAMTFLSTIVLITAAGAAFVSYTFAACDVVSIQHWKNAAAAVYTPDTGVDDRLILTNLRVKSTTAAAVTGSAIVNAALSAARAVNPAMLSADTVGISTTTDDQERALYEDVPMTRMLTELADRGDGSQVYEVGVDENRRLFYRPRWSLAKTYYADIARLEVQADTEDLFNSAYAVYRDDSGRKMRTSTTTDAVSVARYGVTRRLVVSAEFTTSSTTAGNERDAALATTKGVAPRVAIEVDQMTTALGGRLEPWELRPGDILIIRGAQPYLPDSLAQVRVARITLSADGGMEIEATTKLPFLENLVAAALGAQRESGRGWQRVMLSAT